MKSMKLALVGLTVGAAMVTPSLNAATVSVGVTQVISSAIAFTKTADMTFPAADTGAAAATLLPTAAGHGEFRVTGQLGKTYQFSFDQSSINLDDGNGNTIAVNSFVASPAAQTSQPIVSGGTLVKIGATRAALVSQPAGTYTGSFTVTGTYE